MIQSNSSATMKAPFPTVPARLRRAEFIVPSFEERHLGVTCVEPTTSEAASRCRLAPDSQHAPCPTGTARLAPQAHNPIHLEPIHSEPILNRTPISDGARASTSTGVRDQDRGREAKKHPSPSEDPRTSAKKDPSEDPRVQALVRHHRYGHLLRTGNRPAPLSQRGVQMTAEALARYSLCDLAVAIQYGVCAAWEVHEGQLEDILEPRHLAENIRSGGDRYPEVVDAVVEGDKLVVVRESSTSGGPGTSKALPLERTDYAFPIGTGGVR